MNVNAFFKLRFKDSNFENNFLNFFDFFSKITKRITFFPQKVGIGFVETDKIRIIYV